jgi:preprotein translocase subunit SecY
MIFHSFFNFIKNIKIQNKIFKKISLNNTKEYIVFKKSNSFKKFNFFKKLRIVYSKNLVKFYKKFKFFCEDFFIKIKANFFLYKVKFIKLFFYTSIICLLSKVPIFGIDYKGLSKAILFSKNNTVLQTLLSYASFSPYDNFYLNFLSLGILPYVNGSLFIDLAIKNVSSFEEYLKNEGPSSQEKVKFYKKIASLVFGIFYIFLIYSIIKDYFYLKNINYFIFFLFQLLSGSLVIIWISDRIDSLKIVNGISFILCLNLFKNLTGIFNGTIDLKLAILLLSFGFLVYLQQNAKFSIDVISSRQLYFFESVKNFNKVMINSGKSDYLESSSNEKIFSQSKIYIRTNPGGIYPIIIASSIITFFSSIIPKSIKDTFLVNYFYIFYPFYFIILIISCFSYSYLYFDPSKIREEFTKNSIYIRGLSPGEDTEKYLLKIALINSTISGIYLCIILLLFQLSKLLSTNDVNNLLNLSSVIIFIGVISEMQTNLSLLKTDIEKVKTYESSLFDQKNLSKLPIN